MTTTSLRRMREPRKAGDHGPLSFVFEYGLLLVLVAGDYLILAQALVQLNASLSETTSIGATTYAITVIVSLAMIALPHRVATLWRDVADGVKSERARIASIVLASIWLCLVITVTVARIRSSHVVTTTTFVGQKAADTGFDPVAPGSLMTYLTLFVLCASGSISAVIAWNRHRPLLKSVQREQERVRLRRVRRDAAIAEISMVNDTLESAEKLDNLDAQLLKSAYGIAIERRLQLRSEIAAIVAQHQKDPSATSQIIRELRELRDRRAAEREATS